MTEAQFAIRWSMQCGVVTIPKSSNAKRIKEVQTAKALSLLCPAERAFKAQTSPPASCSCLVTERARVSLWMAGCEWALDDVRMRTCSTSI